MSFPNPSPQLSVVLQWYKAVTTWDFDLLPSLMADEYKHSTLPASAGEAPKNKAQGIAHAKAVAALLGNVPIKYEIFQLNETAGSIWVHSRLYNDAATFNSESIFIFTLSSGNNIQITSIQDFIDTKMAAAAAAASSKAQQ
ncbi:hypothetical protein BJV78DRAFT_1173988 [Lactifluus subvellereus]|nr:hypothetical protein BJV78DRAFT_1173988 [Lactifluus subvellereus]